MNECINCKEPIPAGQRLCARCGAGFDEQINRLNKLNKLTRVYKAVAIALWLLAGAFGAMVWLIVSDWR